MTPPDSFGSGVLAGMLLGVGAHALHWFMTPAARPDASAARTAAVAAPTGIGLGWAAWLAWRARRGRAGSGAPAT